MRYVAVGDDDALAAFRRVAELEGILPALEPAHAIAWLLAHPEPGLSLVTLSGRGDKDLAEVLGRVSVAATGVDRIASAFAGHGKRAALMPYLMGGFPDLRASLAAGRGGRRGRRRPDRAGHPVLGSAGRRPRDPRRRHARARPREPPRTASSACASASPRGCR